MKNMEENLLKSCLKGKVKFTTSTLVKFLITGTIAMSLTACGGGGGGGGSSHSGNSELPIKQNTTPIEFGQNKQDTVVLESGYKHVNTGTISGTLKSEGEETKVAVKIKDGTLENNAEVTLQGTNITAFEGENSEIKSTDDITISGENTRFPGIYKFTGISVSGKYGLGMNLGIINIKNDSYIGVDGKTMNELTDDMSKGMYAKNGATIINDISNRIDLGKLGTIKITGSTFGMLAEGAGSKAINKGKIEISGTTTADKVGSIGMGATNGASATNEKDIISNGNISDAFGMITYGGTIENKGNIELNGKNIKGISAVFDKNITTSNINNSNKITLSGTGDIVGIGTTYIIVPEEDPTQAKNVLNIKNNGEITLNKTFKGDTTQIATGIDVLLADGKIDNSGEIVINADGVLNETTDIEDGIHGLQGIQVAGRETGDSSLIVNNKGNITINDKTTGNNDLYIAGIEAWDADVNNSATIAITSNGGDGKKEIYGIDNEGNGFGNKVINSGDIKVTASDLDGKVVGITGENLENSGDINISADMKSDLVSSGYNKVAGIEVFSLDENVNVKNTGDINIQSNGPANYGISVDFLKTKESNVSGTIYNSGNITLSSGVGIYVNNNENDVSGEYKPVNINVINEGNITISGEHGVALEGRGKGVSILNKGTLTLTGDYSTGMSKETNSSQINEGTIVISGKNSQGMMMTTFGKAFDSDFINRGTIKVTGETSTGISVYGVNGTDIEVTKKVSGINENKIIVQSGYLEFPDNMTLEKVIEKSSKGMYAIGHGVSAVNDTEGVIEVSGSSMGMVADEEGEVINKGTIVLTESTAEADKYMTAIGMFANGGIATNEGTILATENVSDTGIMIAYNGGEVINSENGSIQVKADETEAMTAEKVGSNAINKGTIIVIGRESAGMQALSSGTVENFGRIDIDGEDSYGMVAFGEGSTAINKEGATINVGASASGAMLADEGGRIENYGIINIDKDNKRLEDNAENKNEIETDEGNTTVFKAAMEIMNGGTAYNEGEITTDGDIDIKVEGNGAYIIGTNKKGTYGKVSAKNISLAGKTQLSTEIAKDEYENNYFFDNVMSGKTRLEEDFEISSASLLYDATAMLDEKGNLDAELTRNNKNIADFTNHKFVQVASIFDKAISDEKYRETLSDDAKEILDRVFDSTSSAANINGAMKEISGNEHTNIARQIFDTKDLFKSYDNSIINTLGDYNFNFNFIGTYGEVDSKDGINGYDSQITGIAGAMKFTDSLYGVIGYGYNDIDYDGESDGKIETVHTGIYKDIKLESADIRFGVFGEYNFHETERKVFDMTAESDFNSYLAGANVEVSKKYGEDLYLKPTLSLDVSYGKYEDFTEEKANGANLKVESQDYTSIVPAIELRTGKVFQMSEIYARIKYSYELGDMNKEQDIILREFNEKFHLENNDMENAQTDIKVGANMNINNISVNAEIGKEFGKRDREYIKAGFSYTF